MHAMKQHGYFDSAYHQSMHNPQEYQEHLHYLLQNHHHHHHLWPLPPVHPSSNLGRTTQQTDPFSVPWGSNTFFSPKPSNSLHLSYDQHQNKFQILSEALGPVAEAAGSDRFGLQAELAKMRAQEIMDAKALAASKSHSEAERRRRERINNHLSKLRSLLPSTTKTDKASLLAEVIQHVKDLKRQTSVIAETSQIPTEADELTINPAEGEEAALVIKASICCHDRSDLLPDLIEALKSLRLRTLRAEITAVGDRVRNVLFLVREEDTESVDDDGGESSAMSSIQEALRAVMEKANSGDESSLGSVKRQRIINTNVCQYFP